MPRTAKKTTTEKESTKKVVEKKQTVKKATIKKEPVKKEVKIEDVIKEEPIKKEIVKEEPKKQVTVKENNETCCLLHAIASVLFAFSAVLSITTDGFKITGLTYIFLCITFGALAITYYQRYKNEK